MQLLVSSLFVQVLVFAAGAPEIDDHSDALIHRREPDTDKTA